MRNSIIDYLNHHHYIFKGVLEISRQPPLSFCFESFRELINHAVPVILRVTFSLCSFSSSPSDKGFTDTPLALKHSSLTCSNDHNYHQSLDLFFVLESLLP
jgi:hypothetical protein